MFSEEVFGLHMRGCSSISCPAWLPFQDFRACDYCYIPTSVLHRPVVGLGWQSQGYRPTTADYAAYERACTDLLKQPFGRAEPLCGGILWRLYVDSLDMDITSVLAGPSDAAASGGCTLMPAGSPLLVDDMLSESEQDLICGVYHVSTGV
jgi:hypothetical protein